MPVPSVIYNATVNQIANLETTVKVLTVLETNCDTDYEAAGSGYQNVPQNMKAKVTSAKKNAQEALADLQAFYDGYIVANSGA